MQNNEQKKIIKDAQVIEQTLDAFGIKCRVEEINTETYSTLYLITFAKGVRVEQIQGLQQTLSMELGKQVESILPILSKKQLGIRVSN